ncbi:hypothetical protein [Pelagicoccus mobilis]|uniref:Uncharacterized protein n=1 Tax=Pelagicoccus mobilis TaxID=415221 RepID=A0A934VQL5_9BACT|nr:hypothetical protein [Pelagicoccus mobilis]MBK1878467.1 hypothetical protein [Pelagicoccus mobilis]
MLKQYEVLEKRFGLVRQVAQSRWGKGIGEHYSLKGENRGYPLSLYSHFRKVAGRKVEWTSLVFEALFVEDIELCIEFEGTEASARFGKKEGLSRVEVAWGADVWSNADLAKYLASENLLARISSFSKKGSCGAVQLSKGFIEYREVGVMESEEQRLRFQEGILLLANLCDAISLYMSERRG